MVKQTDVLRKQPHMFPDRLYDLLENAEREGFADAVRWMPNGDGFIILKPSDMLPILHRYGFNQTRWKSFLRQLQNYGFHRELRGPNKGRCTHLLFRRGKKELCSQMSRIKKIRSFEFLQPPKTKIPTKVRSTSAGLNQSQSLLHAGHSSTSASSRSSLSGQNRFRSQFRDLLNGTGGQCSDGIPNETRNDHHESPSTTSSYMESRSKNVFCSLVDESQRLCFQSMVESRHNSLMLAQDPAEISTKILDKTKKGSDSFENSVADIMGAEEATSMMCKLFLEEAPIGEL